MKKFHLVFYTPSLQTRKWHQKYIIIFKTILYYNLKFNSKTHNFLFYAKVHQILMEKFQKLLDVPKGQVQM